MAFNRKDDFKAFEEKVWLASPIYKESYINNHKIYK